MTRSRSDQGFSLAEMLVVLAIISTVALVGLNSFTGRKNTESVRTVAQKIERLAALTSLHAVSTGTTASMVVDVANRRISSNYSSDPIQLPPAFKVTVLTGAELIQQNSTASINFYNDATSSGGEITVEDGKGAKRTVRIFWLTGTIETLGGDKS